MALSRGVHGEPWMRAKVGVSWNSGVGAQQLPNTRPRLFSSASGGGRRESPTAAWRIFQFQQAACAARPNCRALIYAGTRVTKAPLWVLWSSLIRQWVLVSFDGEHRRPAGPTAPSHRLKGRCSPCGESNATSTRQGVCVDRALIPFHNVALLFVEC